MENNFVPQDVLVMKFGGTSVGTIQSMKSTIQNIKRCKAERPNLVVVTSAISGATNALIKSATDAAAGNLTTAEKTARELTVRHHDMIDKLVNDPNQWLQLKMDINRMLTDFSNFCNAIKILGELSPRALDIVSSLGERMAVRVLAAGVSSAGIPAKAVEASELILTDDVFQSASPDMARTAEKCKKHLYPLLEQGVVPIVTGFMGATEDGIITTLGRGGSDYSAAIVGVGLDASDVWIWTDVTGVMSADPRIIKDAHTIPYLTFSEISEMAFYGAKVLHPKSVKPCVDNGIRMRICNTFYPDKMGTILVKDSEARDIGKIKAVTSASGFKLVQVAGAGMDSGMVVSAKILNSLVEQGINVPMVIESSSEQAICFPVEVKKIDKVKKTLTSVLEKEIQRDDIDMITVSDQVDILTVICSGFKSHPEAIAQTINGMVENKFDIKAMSFGPSDVSLNLIVNSADTNAALNTIHKLIHND